MSLPEYFNRVNPDLLKLIPPDAKVVLEIGCGAGALCEAYRRVNPGVKWIGVEPNKEAADAAGKHATSVWNDPVEEVEWHLEFSADYDEIDCLVMGDVLEHLQDPWAVLKMLSGHILPSAQVLACIPNVQHWTVIRNLMRGEWKYTDEGLMDRTHLRFFTLSSIREMFDNAGLKVHEIIGRDLFNEGMDAWSNEMPADFPWQKEMRAYQYVVRAVKPATEGKLLLEEVPSDCQIAIHGRIECQAKPIPKLQIHAITAEECCARPRIYEPLAMLRTIPGVKCTTSTGWPSFKDCRQPDILIQQRDRNPIRWDFQRVFVDQTVLIAEVDDLPESIGMDPMALKAVHAVQVSTEALAEVCRQYNPNVMVFENQIAELPEWEDKKRWPYIRIFFGAQNREADWAPIMPALNRIVHDKGEGNISFHVIHDTAFFDALETKHKHFVPFCEYAKYREILRSSDIALLPLEDTPFNRCKSDLKFLECAAEGAVCIASDTVYEQTCAKPGMPQEIAPLAFLYWDAERFEECLRTLIEAIPNERSEDQNVPEWYEGCVGHTTKTAYAYVRDHRLMGQHYRKRYDWYLSLLNSKQALHARLLERCPELCAPSAGHSLQPDLAGT